MLGCNIKGYTRSCAPTVGGLSQLFVADANDFVFTKGDDDEDGNATGYETIARRTGATALGGAFLYPIDSLDETLGWVMTQSNTDGSSSSWAYEISARLAQFGQQMTNFNMKLDAAAACCQLLFIGVFNDGTIAVAGERYVDALPVFGFRLRQDGSKIDPGKKFTDGNGQDLLFKGSYSRPSFVFTGGIGGLNTFLSTYVAP